MIELKYFGIAPAGLAEKSKSVVENIIVLLANGYLSYQMYGGRSYYGQTVDYNRVCLQ